MHYHVDNPGKTIYAYPADQSLADWLTHRVQMVEGASPNTGRYSASLAAGEWVLFNGGDQPADWRKGMVVLTIGDVVPSLIVPLTVKDDSLAVIPYCFVEVTRRGASVVVEEGTTNQSGVVELRLEAGQYDLYRDKRGYTFTDPYIFTVASDGTVTNA